MSPSLPYLLHDGKESGLHFMTTHVSRYLIRTHQSRGSISSILFRITRLNVCPTPLILQLARLDFLLKVSNHISLGILHFLLQVSQPVLIHV
jgi:hypothetical protein